MLWEDLEILVDPRLIRGGGTAYLTYVAMDLTSFFLRLAPDTTSQDSDAGPEFTDDFEEEGQIILELDSGESITLEGISDRSEPYTWAHRQSDAAEAIITAADASSTARITLRLSAHRIEGIGETTVSASTVLETVPRAAIAGTGSSPVTGAAALSRVEPAPVRIGGRGESLVAGVTGLHVMETRHAISGIGSTAIGADSTLAVLQPGARRLSGIGTAAVAASTFLELVEAVRIAGLGASVVSGVSGLHVRETRRLAGVGSSLVRALTGIAVLSPPDDPIAGIGVSLIEGMADLTVVAGDPVPVELSGLLVFPGADYADVEFEELDRSDVVYEYSLDGMTWTDVP